MKTSDRTFIVSGGSSGLGLATVRDLLSRAAYVSIFDRDHPPADLSSSSHIKFFKLDITNVNNIEQAVNKTVEWTLETTAPLGGVINCAGIGRAAKIVNSDGTPHPLDLWDLLIAVNLTGTFNLTRLALKHLIRVKPESSDGERGIVVLVSSAAAFEAQPGQTAYAATKGALASMALPMARDLGRYGVRVLTIAPGAFKSPMTDRFSPKVSQSLITQGVAFPTRFGLPEEFAQTVRWAIECPYVNGEVVRLSGAGRLPGKL